MLVMLALCAPPMNTWLLLVAQLPMLVVLLVMEPVPPVVAPLLPIVSLVLLGNT